MPSPAILPLNKPIGLRSTECVHRVGKLVGNGIKVGHGGTLDSTAEGLLILLTGGATRLSRLIMSLPKTYEVCVRLGVGTSTDDASGEVIAERPWNHVSTEMIDALLPGYMGWRAQVPPQISAVRVGGGKRAHVMARLGEEPTLQPKFIFIKNIRRLSNLSADGTIHFQVDCGKGTYIRSFARDMGLALGSCAHVSFLRRCRLGSFELKDALPALEAFSLPPHELRSRMLGLESLIGTLPSYRADADRAKKLIDGLGVKLEELSLLAHGSFSLDGEILVCGDKLFSLCTLQTEGGDSLVFPRTNIIRESVI